MQKNRRDLHEIHSHLHRTIYQFRHCEYDVPDPETDPDQPSVLSFSRPIEPGFEDSAYYFEINDQSYGSYEGLEFVKLSRNKLEIKLEDWVLEKFGEADFAEVTVEFEADDEKFQAILENMRRIFKGFEDIYQEA